MKQTNSTPSAKDGHIASLPHNSASELTAPAPDINSMSHVAMEPKDTENVDGSGKIAALSCADDAASAHVLGAGAGTSSALPELGAQDGDLSEEKISPSSPNLLPALAHREAAPVSPYPVFVPYRDFDWQNKDVQLFLYSAWWGDKPLFEVGYLQTPTGLQTSERRVLAERQGYCSLMTGIKRPLYRVGTVSDLNRVLFVEDERAADVLNGRFAKAGLGKLVVATTTSRGPGHAARSDIDAEIHLEYKEIIVFVSARPGGESDADHLCRLCWPHVAWLKRIELSDMAPNGSQEEYFRSLPDLTGFLELIEEASAIEDTPFLEDDLLLAEGEGNS